MLSINENGAVQHVPENVIDQGLEDLTKYSKWPNGVLNAVFHSSPSWMRTKWYALRRSSSEKTTALWRGTKVELMRGKGYLFFTVIPFRPR